MSYEIEKLASDWIAYKSAEKAAVEARRECEDKLLELLHIPEQFEGTNNFTLGENKVKIVSKFTRKINSDLLQEIAAEHGLTAKLSTLFKWSADINLAFWRIENDDVKSLFSNAILTKPARPTFNIERGE